ncbi:hypothetical protein LR48_Vigan07g224200 [Vigna angularis]|uniref:Uncharacterized protein n=1 Tax=Phaseolus angularis TaxID=3914 RepID=A0A0L9V0I6_PHAAN|nr:hypothetical protein LR48_Vigan07g224200 [Vigna angularis]
MPSLFFVLLALWIKIVYRLVGNGDSDNSWTILLVVMKTVGITPYGSEGYDICANEALIGSGGRSQLSLIL